MNIKIKENKILKSLFIDGKPQMMIPQDKNKQKFMGEILFVHKMNEFISENTNILNIGLGAGYTTREILKQNVKSVDVVEFYQEVIDLLKEFDTYLDIINDKRCNIICDEATNFVSTTNKKYDVIIVDVCQPDLELSKKLFELEFFQELKKVLNQNGIILFWYYNIKHNDKLNIAKNMIENLKSTFNFIDFILIKESIYQDTYFFISDDPQEKDENSILKLIE
jgi:spermidine synthase